MLEILKAGLNTSLQSSPRKKALDKGISMGGAADFVAAKLANLLLDQPEDLAVLEIVSSPFEATLVQNSFIAFAGAGMQWEDDQNRVFRAGSVAFFNKESRLTAKPTKEGFRAYLGIKSGFKSAFFEGSFSTDLRLNKGGSEGLVKKGDLLMPNNSIQSAHLNSPKLDMNWHLSHEVFSYVKLNEVRLIPTFEHQLFSASEIDRFKQTDWQVSSQSNRMGIRLVADKSEPFQSQKLYSSTVLPGTVQITPNGPIILMQDAQTAGGYPRIGQVIEADLPILAQKNATAFIRFNFITIEEAIAIKKDQKSILANMSQAIRWKYADEI
jgi:antagonist of KipI